MAVAAVWIKDLSDLESANQTNDRKGLHVAGIRAIVKANFVIPVRFKAKRTRNGSTTMGSSLRRRHPRQMKQPILSDLSFLCS